MTAINLWCGKPKYHGQVFGDPDHGDWDRGERAKWQCGHVPDIEPVREGVWYVDPANPDVKHLNRTAARRAISERLAPVDRTRDHYPREHGTEAGYHQHYRRQEPICPECQAAHNAYVRGWEQGWIRRGGNLK